MSAESAGSAATAAGQTRTDDLGAVPEVRETHTGIVFLVGDRAYKVKKPVRTDFLDFGSVEARERVCAHEVLLNSRLAPGSYLGVGHFIGPHAESSEPIVVMRRYPQERSLARLVTSSGDHSTCVRAVAETLARFHRKACRCAAVDADASPAALTTRWESNLEVLARYVGPVFTAAALAEVDRRAHQYLSGRAALLAGRVAQGRIVDGHGDLQAEDIFCMPEGGPVLLDCLEFDDRLRHVDGLDDAAFLAMDLAYLGRPDLATEFLATYRALTEDGAPESLAHFYIAYRAVVRAKVECIRADQGQSSAVSQAQRHLELAAEHLRAATVFLVIVGGGPGTGKTTLAGALAKRLDAVVVSTDDMRFELVRSHQIDGEPGRFGSGLYDPRNVATVYDTVLQRAATLLAHGHSVILDGTWRNADDRQRARAVAVEYGCPTVEFVCSVDLASALERIHRRGPRSHSQVTTAVAERLHADAPAWPTAHRLDTSRPLADCVEQAVTVCAQATRMVPDSPTRHAKERA